MMRVDAIAFDLDGTLVHSAPGIAHALNVALAAAGLAPFDLRKVQAWIGDGPDALIARALAASGRENVDAPDLPARLRRDFDAATLAAPMAGCSVFDGVAQAVESLAEMLPLVVVTNKPTLLARAVLGEAGLLERFASVHGADTTAQRKPSPLSIRQAADGLGCTTARMLMVGDAAIDIEAAHAAGCHAAWAAWGYGRAPEQTTRTVWAMKSPRELLDWVGGHVV